MVSIYELINPKTFLLISHIYNFNLRNKVVFLFILIGFNMDKYYYF